MWVIDQRNTDGSYLRMFFDLTAVFFFRVSSFRIGFNFGIRLTVRLNETTSLIYLNVVLLDGRIAPLLTLPTMP